ncbi:hypothetical protein BaRGS_00007856 [Batillaria attramentaria]|uniref:Uncharacterized protein n=1 Tax=Batillaria attramentaria TaxID=370345 RepID=A0ABD0LP04_9CAEN
MLSRLHCFTGKCLKHLKDCLKTSHLTSNTVHDHRNDVRHVNGHTSQNHFYTYLATSQAILRTHAHYNVDQEKTGRFGALYYSPRAPQIGRLV